MIDWFIVLTPILLLPIALLFFYLGCDAGEITNVAWVEVTFAITFFLVDDRLNHDFEFRIRDSSLDVVASETNKIQVITEGAGGEASRVFHQFTLNFPQPILTTLSCQVVDTFDPVTLVANGDGCQVDLQLHEQYVIVFDALVSDDGVVPNNTFDFCSVTKL